MSKIQVFDPPMCCASGVCGPEVDPALVQFASDLEWLEANGVEVERFNPTKDPAAFTENTPVAQAAGGRADELPLLLVDGRIVAQGSYPEREVLAALVGVATPKGIYGEAVQALVAIGAAIASNCEPCFRYHFDVARKLGVSKEDAARAVATAKAVRESPARAVVELAEKYLGTRIATAEGPNVCRRPQHAAPAAQDGGNPGSKKCC